MRVFLAVFLVLPVLTSADPASADLDPIEPIRIEFQGPIVCSDEQRFFDEIRVRTERVRPAQPTELAREFLLSMQKVGSRFVGSISLADGRRKTRPRKVAAKTCEEAVATMALIAALSVSPQTSVAPATTERTADAGAAPEGAADAASDATLGDESGERDDRVIRALTFDDPEDAKPVDDHTMQLAQRLTDFGNPSRVIARLLVDPSIADQARAPRWDVAVGGGVSVLTADGILAAPQLFVDLVRDTPDPFAPAMRIGAEWARGQMTANTGVSARPTWFVADASFCPFRTLRIDLTACADVQAGVVSVAASGTNSQSAVGGWFAPGLSARFTTPPAHLTSRADLFFEADLGFRVPVAREAFTYFKQDFYPNNDNTAYQAPVIIGHGEVAAGVRFW